MQFAHPGIFKFSQVGATKIAITFFKLDQLTWKWSQIEAKTYGCVCRLIFGTNICNYYDFLPL